MTLKIEALHFDNLSDMTSTIPQNQSVKTNMSFQSNEL